MFLQNRDPNGVVWGSGIRVVRKAERRKENSFEMKCLRSLEEVSRDTLRNEAVCINLEYKWS